MSRPDHSVLPKTAGFALAGGAKNVHRPNAVTKNANVRAAPNDVDKFR
jgi:hypothetical protein